MSIEVPDPNNPTFGEMSVTIYPQYVPYEKPYSLREFVAAKGVANGIASLGSDGKIPSAQLPSAIASGMSFVGQWKIVWVGDIKRHLYTARKKPGLI